MPVRGTKPTEGPKRHRGAATHEWTEVEDRPYTGKVPVRLPARRELIGPKGPVSVPVTALTKNWWKSLRRMPHCALWSETDWHFALATALVADLAFRGIASAASELRQREKVMGTTVDARRDLRIRYVTPGEGSSAGPGSRGPSAAEHPETVTSLDDRRRRLTSAS